MANSQILIGVASTVVPRIREQGSTIRRPTPYFCDMAAQVHRLGAKFLLFAPDDIIWSRRLVSAWTPMDSSSPYKSWTRVVSPLPDVIYENIYVHLAIQGHAVKMRQMAKQLKIPVMNPALPGKWHMHRWMKRVGLADFVPDTELLDDVNHALRLIREWRVAYVKPVGGYGGVGVTRVQHVGDNQYRISLDRTAKSFEKKRTEVSEAKLRGLLRKRKTPSHLIQRGLDLLTIGGRKVDFRVVVHRGGDDDWHLVGIVPKQAAPDGVVTNIIAGGQRLTLERCLELARTERIRVPIDTLEKVSLRIARALGKRRPTAGLLGFDMGIDRQGQVYMIEMNPKPARSLLTTSMRRQAAIHTAEFAVYLAKHRRGVKLVPDAGTSTIKGEQSHRS